MQPDEWIDKVDDAVVAEKDVVAMFADIGHRYDAVTEKVAVFPPKPPLRQGPDDLPPRRERLGEDGALPENDPKLAGFLPDSDELIRCFREENVVDDMFVNPIVVSRSF